MHIPYKEAYLAYKIWDSQEVPYAERQPLLMHLSSHQPVLIHMLNTMTKGPVLEVGVGNHSTPIMHLICANQNRKLLSVETDERWYLSYRQLKSKWHDVDHVTEEKLINGDYPFFKNKFALAFIDGTRLSRQPMIERLANKVDYLIVHDTEEIVAKRKYDETSYNYDFSMFKNVFHFKCMYPCTSVLTNLNSINLQVYEFFNR